MFDFRLKVFHTVAKRLNFTKAAEELNITQPAVTKHIKEIESYLKSKVFERNGTKITLTLAGETLLKYTEQIFSIYRQLDYDINNLNERHKGTLRIGASTTVAQYILPPVLAGFHQKYKDIKVSLTIDNSEKIDLLLQQKKIDLGIVEGRSRNNMFKYTEFLKDEIVLVTNSNNELAKKAFIEIEELKEIPLLLREPGSGTLEIIAHHLKPFNIKISELNREMQLGNSESIKAYLQHSNCFTFLSVHSVVSELTDKRFTIVDVKDLTIERYFYFMEPQGETASLIELFKNFAFRYNFK
ncbi:LysR substrate-binding domain-containing protein [Pseudopedobacter beijingensis]|uniref:LysR substrate-binding domain-containing protein n=1 Tax=Pseudopedobacter beijingensis TaxID=1207056 RepID=A0ABW4IFX9_9SPHI